MKYLILIIFLSFSYISTIDAQDANQWNPQNHNMIQSDRSDGRFLSSFGFAHWMLEHTTPKYAFRGDFSKSKFSKWKKEVRQAMKTLMKMPVVKNRPKPTRQKSELRKGYRVEKWEFYPLPGCVSTFLVLIPDNQKKSLPGILCIPGSGASKEGLAGEPSGAPLLNDPYIDPKHTMALNYVIEGYVAVVVDNPAAGEASDLEQYVQGRNYNYDLLSRYLLELDWSYLGYTSFLDLQVLEWMKTQDYIRKDRIVVSGFSLGTEPLMVLGVLDPSIYAFVYNDFLCQTQERAIVMTMPQDNGVRPFPNSIRHLIPGFWKYFNFPDIVAALAPRPLILTEGGLDRDLDLVKRAYEISGHASKVEIHHYNRFADPKNRKDIPALPKGLDRNNYYKMVNVDGSNHFFKSGIVIPWLKKTIVD